jgi:acetyltransferase-like isoleucine patch superfamily enzyme
MRSVLKMIGNGIALLLVLPFFLLYRLETLLLGRHQVFPGWSQALSLIPGLTGVFLRRAFYNLVFPRLEKDVCISFGVIFSHATAALGKTVFIGPFCCLGDITLEDDVLIGSHVSIANGGSQHGTERLDIPMREQPGTWPRITIGQDTWIGDRAVILADVGKKCLIAAGAVVTKPIPDYAVAAGVPARVVRYRNQSAPGPEMPVEVTV